MWKIKRLLFLFTCVVIVGFTALFVQRAYHHLVGPPTILEEVRQRVQPNLRADLRAVGLEFGQDAFIRIFKEESELEIWLSTGAQFKHFRTYEICNFSGDLGPKLKEGDRQSPEGFYAVNQAAMNPQSSYHLSFNLGFPNRFDRANNRSGSFLMVHGDCVSVGCYAMTDANIEEIYLIVEAAQFAGQTHVPVHAFPFRMTHDRLMLEQDNVWFEYWQNLKAGYDYFEKDRVPPTVSEHDRQYVFSSGIGS